MQGGAPGDKAQQGGNNANRRQHGPLFHRRIPPPPIAGWFTYSNSFML
jgi:hypothetical protein